MQTMLLEVTPARMVLTKALSRLSPAAYFGPTSPLHLVNLPDPPLPADMWVRVRNRMCGICGSDLHQIFLDASLDVAPTALPAHRRSYLGHEMVGEVVEVREGVTNLRVGDRVVRWGRGDDCRARGRQELCPACQRGHRVLCEVASEPRPHEPIGGGFGDTFITPASTCIQVPADVCDEQAIFAEPLAVAIHAAYRHLPQPHDRVLVLGCGSIGFLLIQVLRLLQPTCEITALAEFDWQATLARQLGADHIFLASDAGDEHVAHITQARLYRGRAGNTMLMGGFDAVYDVVGIPATLNKALRWTRALGTVVLVGVYLHQMRIDLTPVWYQEVSLLGSIGHGVVLWQGEAISTFDLALRWMALSRIQTDTLLTHRFPLSAYRQAFWTATHKAETQSIKTAFTFSP
ncbi:MAG: alcohol dehydrogenase catalytic domain-containing protein [Chloroflexi bacterium]|nr:alcohol dehydrogenase catalytic domain-containing protein [Chloroflexota bacterium]